MRRKQAGFTLLELLAVSAMTLVVAASLFGSMIAQQRSYAFQLAASDASQNARAALSIVKNELRLAGWGLTGRFGGAIEFPAVGTCRNTSNKYDCAGGTTDSDSLRIMSMVPTRFSDSTEWTGALALRTHRLTDFPTGGGTDDTDPLGVPANTLAFIDGICSATTDPDVDIVEVNSATASTTLFRHTYTLDNPPTEYPTPSCPGGFNADFKFGMARIVDFWIDRNETTPDSSSPTGTRVLPRLMMQVNRGSNDINGNPSQETVVAYDIDSFEIEYGLDLGLSEFSPIVDTDPDQIVDLWCNDLNACNTSGVLSSAITDVVDLASRVIAIRLAVIPIAPSTQNAVGASFTGFDHVMSGDRNRRWIFRSTVRLRNNELDRDPP
ncbi:MAG: PilW family protein [Myxococcota bacterium]